MGNCIRKESAMQCVDDDWNSPATGKIFSGNGNKAIPMKVEKEDSINNVEGEGKKKRSGNSYLSSSGIGTEVKIKISKKQLEELLGRMSVEGEGLSVEHLLAQLMKASDHFETQQQRSSNWRPSLQSIPEVN